MVIKKKSPAQAKLYDILFDKYEKEGRQAAVQTGMMLVKAHFTDRRIVNALIEEIDMCYQIG